MGYTNQADDREYRQYAENFVRSAIAPDTMVAAVAQKTSWNTKEDQLKPSKSRNMPHSGFPMSPMDPCSPIIRP